MSAGQHTKWHRFLECVSGYAEMKDSFAATGGRLVVETIDAVEKLGYANTSIPIFKISKDTLVDIRRSDFESFSSSIDSLPWPFERFIIETEDRHGSIFMDVMKRSGKGLDFVVFVYGNALSSDQQSVAMLCGLSDDSCEMGEHVRRGPADIARSSSLQECATDAIDVASFAFMSLMMEIATKGMIQKRIEGPKSLNDKRVRKGKPRIPDVIYMRPGYYYDRSGARHECDERKPVRIHWRRGHTRNVWCGVGDGRHLEPRYIAPCLVNYEGGDVPEHKVRVLQ
jgi:hypothetical protein